MDAIQPRETSSACPPTRWFAKRGRADATGAASSSLRRPIPQWLGILLGVLCIAAVLGIWWFLTRGVPEERILQLHIAAQPGRNIRSRAASADCGSINALTRNLLASLRRVVLGFALAAAVGIPLGVLCGCFPWVNSFLAPINVFGRNIPIAALIPLTFALFGIGELQKVMFIFIAAVAFVMMDTASAVADVSGRYIDTAYTLGASRLADHFESARAAGDAARVQLAAAVVRPGVRLHHAGRAGDRRRAVPAAWGTSSTWRSAADMAKRSCSILMVIPAVALAIDRLLFMIQKSLFPYQYGSDGVSAQCRGAA